MVIMNLIRKVYDSKQVVMMLGLDGKHKSATLDPEMPQAHQDGNKDVDAIFNPLVGRYDIVIDTGPSYQTQRQESAEALTNLSKGNPQLMQVAGDLIMRSYDFPMAEEMAKRLEKTLPPGLKDEEDGQPQVPPQLQQKMQQQDEMIKQMGTALENAHTEVTKLEEEKEFKLMELQIKAQDSDTKRLQVVGAGMSPEQIQALVAESVQAALANSPSQQFAEEQQEVEQGEPQPDPNAQLMDMVAGLHGKMDQSNQLATQHGELVQGIHGLTQQLARPKTIIRDETGRAVGTQ